MFEALLAVFNLTAGVLTGDWKSWVVGALSAGMAVLLTRQRRNLRRRWAR